MFLNIQTRKFKAKTDVYSEYFSDPESKGVRSITDPMPRLSDHSDEPFDETSYKMDLMDH